MQTCQLGSDRLDVCLCTFVCNFYNPMSIARAIDILLNKDHYSADDLFESRGTWHSFDHHSRFSYADHMKNADHSSISFMYRAMTISRSNSRTTLSRPRRPICRFSS